MKKMKNIILLIASMTFINTVEAQRISSSIKEITVYQQQAHITREASVSVPKGYQQLVLTGIPNNVNKSTIQVQGKGDFVILGIKHQQNFLSDDTLPTELKKLRDELETAETRLETTRNAIKILKLEEDMLIQNQSIGGTDNTLTVAQLEAMANFMTKRFTALEHKKIKYSKEEKEQLKALEKLKKEIKNRTAFYQNHSSEIVVDVEARNTAPAKFSIAYVARNAGWYPEYDVRAASETEKLEIAYKANVYQSTGEKWDDISLTLSTGNPSISNVKPALFPWYVDIYQPQPRMMKRSMSSARMEASAMEEVVEMEGDMEINSSVEDFVSVTEGTVNTEYSIDKRYTVPSDGKPIAIEIQSSRPNADFEYAAVPKYNQHAFLVAKIKEWDNYDMLPGKMNIYLDDTFVGESYLQSNTTDEEIVLSLGRDERIVLKRERLKDYTSKNFIGSKKKETYGYSITVKNTKKKTIKLTIEDNIPISQNSEIVIKIVDTGSANYDEKKGLLKWAYTLTPNESKKTSFGYEVSYPKDKRVNGL